MIRFDCGLIPPIQHLPRTDQISFQITSLKVISKSFPKLSPKSVPLLRIKKRVYYNFWLLAFISINLFVSLFLSLEEATSLRIFIPFGLKHLLMS